MFAARTTVDGLWRCLCPSVDVATLTRPVSIPRRPRLSRPCPSKGRDHFRRRKTAGLLHTTARSCQDGVQSEKDPFHVLVGAEVQRQRGQPFVADTSTDESSAWLGDAQTGGQQQNPHGTGSTKNEPDPSKRPEERLDGQAPKASAGIGLDRTRIPKELHGTVVERLVHMQPPFANYMPDATTEQIYEALRNTRHNPRPGMRKTTAALVKRLMANGAAPSTFLYETMLIQHALTEGSADVVRKLLQEMRDKKIPWSSTAYHSAIRALAIHPDYLLRNDVIREMKERWIEIEPRGHRYILLGLLRDEQYELALEKLEEMTRTGIPIDSWVFQVFIYVFGKLGFTDDALRIVRHRLDNAADVPVNIWYYVLDICSKSQNHEATTYIWNRAVESGMVNPSDGIALNVLNMAAAYGDTELATRVIQYLASRGTRLSRPHYEALADAYNAQGNMERAIEVFCIMHGAGADVNPSTTGSLSQALRHNPALIDEAVQAMAQAEEKYTVPIGVFNAVLNEMVKSDAPTPEEAFDKALGLYRRIREFAQANPNMETFRNLLWKCTRPDAAQFLAAEMVHFKIRQTLGVMELMLKIHVEHHGPTHRIKGYFYNIAPHLRRNYPQGSRKWRAMMSLSVTIVKRLVAERDPEAWRILQICRRIGLDKPTIMTLRSEVEAGKVQMHNAAAHPENLDQDVDSRSVEDILATV